MLTKLFVYKYKTIEVIHIKTKTATSKVFSFRIKQNGFFYKNYF